MSNLQNHSFSIEWLAKKDSKYALSGRMYHFEIVKTEVNEFWEHKLKAQ